MNHEDEFKTHDGQHLYGRWWEPAGETRAHLALIHGYGEHCSRYEHVAEAFNRAGIAVHSYDQRGFGHSPGKRGVITRFESLLQDLGAFLAHIQPRFLGRPCFLMGHSMGGLELAIYAETRPIHPPGLVFSSPFLAFTGDVPAILLALADLLGVLAPWLPVHGIDNAQLSRNPAVVEAADADPLSFHGKINAGTGAQFTAAIRKARANFGKINAPAYIIHGEQDRLVPCAGSKLLYEGIRSEDKQLKIYEGGYHELWNDLDRAAVITAIVEWVVAHIATERIPTPPR